MHWHLLPLVVVLAGVGCAGPEAVTTKSGSPMSPPKPTPKVAAPAKSHKGMPNLAPVIQPVAALSGKVVLVNAPLKYVVIEGVIGRLPPVDQTLNVYRDGQKVGVVVVSNQVRGANFAADLTQGEVRVGDAVRSD
jgi:hypothetical protein